MEPNHKMIALFDLVKRYYCNPLTNESNSIKDVLPAILNTSDYLQDKYSKPIYGGVNGIASLNYKDWIWIEYDENGNVKDPYDLLPPMFQGLSDKEYKLLYVSNIISDSGAALTAYSKLQYETISDYERNEMNAALLKYCELGTLAMIMIYEAWREFINNYDK